MASMCLSSVLTGANMAMYQTGIADILQQPPSGDFTAIVSGKQHNEAGPISPRDTLKFTAFYE